MMFWSHIKFTMFWTNYADFGLIIYIIYFFIIISEMMFHVRLPYKIFIITTHMPPTLRTALTHLMTIWCLPKLTVFWTNYANFNVPLFIVYFRIIVFVP